MERIDELLKKYFEGTSTLAEEKELKTYFNGENIAENHRTYKSLFCLFESERTEISPCITPITEDEKAKKINRKIILFTLSGIAACLLAITVIRTPSSSEDYLIQHGKRINNPELAQQMARKKLEKSLAVVTRRLEPMQTLGKVETKMEKIEKIEKINQIKQDIHNKLSKIK